MSVGIVHIMWVACKYGAPKGQTGPPMAGVSLVKDGRIGRGLLLACKLDQAGLQPCELCRIALRSEKLRSTTMFTSFPILDEEIGTLGEGHS